LFRLVFSDQIQFESLAGEPSIGKIFLCPVDP